MRKIDTLPTVRLCRALPAFMFAAAILGLAEFSALAAGTRIDRETIWIDLAGDPVGKPPPDFVFWQTGHGRWSIVRDSSTESGAAIEQSGAGTQEAQPSLAVYQPDSLKNVVVSARIKLVKGSLQTAGLAVRVTAPNTYYAAAVNAIEGRVELFRFDAGKRRWLAGAEADVEEGHWQSFQIAVVDDHFSVSLDGQVLFDAWDHGYVGDGRVALWTEEDNSTRFDNIAITPLPHREGNR